MRERFGVTMTDCGGAITWAQYEYLVQALADDPRTRLAFELSQPPVPTAEELERSRAGLAARSLMRDR